jgi:hypothetical protein
MSGTDWALMVAVPGHDVLAYDVGGIAFAANQHKIAVRRRIPLDREVFRQQFFVNRYAQTHSGPPVICFAWRR